MTDPVTDERQVQAMARLVEARDHPVTTDLPDPWDPAWQLTGDDR
jgi:hypothetical protein